MWLTKQCQIWFDENLQADASVGKQEASWKCAKLRAINNARFKVSFIGETAVYFVELNQNSKFIFDCKNSPGIKFTSSLNWR